MVCPIIMPGLAPLSRAPILVHYSHSLRLITKESSMPTPFMHLHMVEKIMPHQQAEELISLLKSHLPAFSFGNIAPDFQAICDIKRETTHYYPIPPEKDDYNAFDRLLDDHPRLRSPEQIPLDEAIFTAGYGAHLLFDLMWDHHVLTPHFRNADWAEPRIRFLAHNIMLTYLDREARAPLSANTSDILSQAKVTQELSFAPTEHLHTWKKEIADQLKPGTRSQTVDIYAKRMRMTPEEFIAKLDDPIWMDEHVFQRVPWTLVQNTIDTAVPHAITLIQKYLKPITG